MRRKNIIKLFLVFCFNVALIAVSTGCAQKENDFSQAMNENEEAYVFNETESYKNFIEMDKSWGEISTDNNSAAIGDPFVMRYDGKYYMYPSTAGELEEERGIRVFVSEDLVNWQYEGFAAVGEGASYGWAPEVLYYNGTFYMVTSPSGEGHYILTSENPTGPFKKHSYIGCDIDGSLYVGDDGSIYFLYAEYGYDNMTSIVKMSEDMTELTNEKVQALSYLGAWAEGPNLFRRNNIQFLTYTGNGVKSETYRVGYSYSLSEDVFGDWYIWEDNNVLLNASGNGYYGLGHSCNVVGPNLDSWYTAYHAILTMNAPFHREMMIDQLVTNGTMLLANGPTYNNVAVPTAPDFETRDVKSGFLSKDKTSKIYTVEYNLQPKSQSVTECRFAYKDEANYTAIRWDMLNQRMLLIQLKNGEETELASADAEGMLPDKLHTIRVLKGADTVEVYLDSMKKMEASGIDIGRGYIGVQGDATYSYIAFTNDAFGTSDFDAVKNVPSSFPAVHYLKGENRGWSISNAVDVEGGIRQDEPENTRMNEMDLSSALILDTPNDWVKYAINTMEESWYGVCGTVTASSAGAKVQIIIDESEIYTFTVPETGTAEEEYVNVMLGQVPLTQGNHTMKIRLCSGTLEIHTLDMVLTNPTELTYESALNEIDGVGWIYRGLWEVKEDALTAIPSNAEPMYAFAGDDKMTDFSMQVDMAVLEDGTMYEGGIFFHVDEICAYRWSYAEGMQGYFLGFRNDQVTLYRYNYQATETLDFAKVDFENGEYHTIGITMKNNHIVICIDDMDTPVIDYYDADAFLSGQIMLGSNGTALGYKNIKIQTMVGKED